MKYDWHDWETKHTHMTQYDKYQSTTKKTKQAWKRTNWFSLKWKKKIAIKTQSQ